MTTSAVPGLNRHIADRLELIRRHTDNMKAHTPDSIHVQDKEFLLSVIALLGATNDGWVPEGKGDGVMAETIKDGWYWVKFRNCSEPEIARAVSGCWYDFADDPGEVPSEYVTVLRGPLRSPPRKTLETER